MSLQSELFRGDPKLEAAATSNQAHITPGSVGEHVRKIQQALIALDAAVIDPGELVAKRYGRSTSSAVLSYKKKRQIINFSYQTQADDIVGVMTIAALDNEIKEFTTVVAAVQAVINFGYYVLRDPSIYADQRHVWQRLNRGIHHLEKRLAKYRGIETPAATFASPLVGVVIVVPITVLILLILLLIAIGHALSSREFREARDERAKELKRMLEELRGEIRQMTIQEARDLRDDAKELDALLEECRAQHPEKAEACKDKSDAYEEAKKKYLQDLFILINCLQNRGCKDATKQFLEHLERAKGQFIDALNALHDCLGCTNF